MRSYPYESSVQLPITQFIAGASMPQSSGGDDRAVAVEGAAASLETSLSPDMRDPSTQPAEAGESGAHRVPSIQGGTEEESNIGGVSLKGDSAASLQLGEEGFPSLRCLQDLSLVGTTRQTEVVKSRQGKEVVATIKPQVKLGKQFMLIPKPSEIILTMILTAIRSLEQAVSGRLNAVDSQVTCLEQRVGVLECGLSETATAMQEVKQQTQSSLEVQQHMLKDLTSLRYRNELLENKVRSSNLRILNFPRSRLLSARELIKKFMMEVLSFQEETVPPIVKLYYLPYKKKIEGINVDKLEAVDKGGKNLQSPVSPDSLDLSGFLESSQNDIQERATLLITFAFESDKDLVMKLYFQLKSVKFMGQRVWLFPDISKETQKKRKEFLSMRGDVLLLKGSFSLRFSVKCIIKIDGNSYVFFEPKQLRNFLDLKTKLE